jgi:hypothetical protein
MSGRNSDTLAGALSLGRNSSAAITRCRRSSSTSASGPSTGGIACALNGYVRSAIAATGSVRPSFCQSTGFAYGRGTFADGSTHALPLTNRRQPRSDRRSGDRRYRNANLTICYY